MDKIINEYKDINEWITIHIYIYINWMSGWINYLLYIHLLMNGWMYEENYHDYYDSIYESMNVCMTISVNQWMYERLNLWINESLNVYIINWWIFVPGLMKRLLVESRIVIEFFAVDLETK